MNSQIQYRTIESLDTHASIKIKAHFGQLFDRYSGGSYPDSTPGCFQLLTGEPHPLGNFCIIDPSVPVSVATSMVYFYDGLAGILQASEIGSPVHRRIGFQSHGTMRMFVRMPAT